MGAGIGTASNVGAGAAASVFVVFPFNTAMLGP